MPGLKLLETMKIINVVTDYMEASTNISDVQSMHLGLEGLLQDIRAAISLYQV